MCAGMPDVRAGVAVRLEEILGEWEEAVGKVPFAAGSSYQKLLSTRRSSGKVSIRQCFWQVRLGSSSAGAFSLETRSRGETATHTRPYTPIGAHTNRQHTYQ